jgi:hypothetical protein
MGLQRLVLLSAGMVVGSTVGKRRRTGGRRNGLGSTADAHR